MRTWNPKWVCAWVYQLILKINILQKPLTDLEYMLLAVVSDSNVLILIFFLSRTRKDSWWTGKNIRQWYAIATHRNFKCTLCMYIIQKTLISNTSITKRGKIVCIDTVWCKVNGTEKKSVAKSVCSIAESAWMFVKQVCVTCNHKKKDMIQKNVATRET